jgi:glycosyltransferase involved in cell wall biosynthesis
MKKLLSVVIPVYNNEPSLEQLCANLLEMHAPLAAECDLEVIMVNDGSADRSWEKIVELQARHPGVLTGVKLSRNFGQLAATLAGYGQSRGDAVVTISADLQDPTSLIPEMYKRWREGMDIVIAHRSDREDAWSASFASRLAYAVARAANPRMPKGGFDFQLMSRRALDTIMTFTGRHRFFQGDLLWMGYPTAFIPYVRLERPHGKSTWTLSRKLKYFIDLVVDSSYLPIRAMSALGFLVAILGLAYAALIVYSWTVHATPFEGWAPIMVITLVIGGMIMMMLGILGEYLWRLYDDVRAKPLYIVEEARSPGGRADGERRPAV